MGKEKILVVEDEGIIAQEIQSRLISLGYQVPMTVSSGVEAIRQAEKIRPDLVLMDIVLKGDMDGIEAAKKIREQFYLPIIFLTAYGDDRTLNRSKVSDPFGYILKPFEELELRISIEIGLYKHRMENKLRHAHAILEERVKARTAELNRAKEEAIKANNAKSEFLSNMSHELRTPLNHIIGFTELVVDKHFGPLNNRQEEYLTDVLNSSRHLLSIINDILDISKIEAGKEQLKLSEVDIGSLIQNSMLVIKEKTHKHRILSTISVEGLPTTITADEKRLKQVMYNLLSNAVKFTPASGSIEVTGSTLTVKNGYLKTIEEEQVPLSWADKKVSVKEGRVACVVVRDTGIGLTNENLEKIFGAFDQVDSPKKSRFQGTGLGLSLTKRFVEMHGGNIWAESDGLNHGSTFTFIIPCTKD